MEPSIQVHCPPLYFQRSFNKRLEQLGPVESQPNPPNNQTLPEASSLALAPQRPPGKLLAEGTFWVPSTPGWLKPPPCGVHVFVPMLYSHKSFRNAKEPSWPPNSQRWPVAGSVQVTA